MTHQTRQPARGCPPGPTSRRAPWWGALIAVLLTLLAAFAAAQETGSVRGRLFEDFNRNGNWDAGEVALKGLSSHIVGSQGTFAAASNDAGQFSISAPAGQYDFSPPRFPDLIPTNRFSDKIDLPPGGFFDIGDQGFFKNCAGIKVKKILWLPNEPGCVLVTFELTNLAPYPIGHIFTLNQLPVIVQSPLTGSQNYIPVNPPLAPGATQTFTIKVCGVAPNTSVLIDLNLHDPELRLCCPGQLQLDLPACDCFQVLEEEIKCNDDGSVTWCATIQNLNPNTIFYVFIAPPAGMTINPTVTYLGAGGVPFGGTFTLCVTITGATPGTTLNLPIVIRDKVQECCRGVVPIEIPLCTCLVAGECWDKAPIYDDFIADSATGALVPYSAAFPGTVAVITCGIQNPGNNVLDTPVVAIHNLTNYQTTAVPYGQDWVPAGYPRGYMGPVSALNPMGAWNIRNLGTVFGVTLDRYGNIFVTHSSAYSDDYLSTITNQPGWIYMIENGTGNIYPYCKLPNVLDPSAPAGQQQNYYPGLGNITYDGDHDQFFVTNLEDGKIYRVAGTGGAATSQATWIDTYDPVLASAGFTADNGAPGVAPLGDRLWGVQYHDKRVYFGRWRVDAGAPSATDFNEVWSIDIAAAGGTFGSNLKLEVTVPHFAGNSWSSPISDISFNVDGKMMIAERGNGAPWTNPWAAPHGSRGIEYTCDPQAMKWVPSNLPMDIGASTGSNPPTTNGWQSSSGGVDYDYSTASIAGNPASGARVWFTINGWFVAGVNQSIYGIQGLNKTTGGNMLNSILNDADGSLNTTPKTQIGDVEIPCPPQHPAIRGKANLQGLVVPPTGRTVRVSAYVDGSSDPVASVTTILAADGTFSAPLDLAPGTYRLSVKSPCFLRAAIADVSTVNPPSDLTFHLLSGDIDGDNVVGLFDYLLLSENFDKTSADPDWSTKGSSGFAPMECDLDGDGAVSLFDYILLSDNWDKSGD